MSEENVDKGSKLQNFFEKLMAAIGISNFEIGKVVANGLSRCDIYVPEHDLIVMFDGPCHYLQTDKEIPTSFSEMLDLK